MDATIYSRIKEVLNKFSEPYFIPRNEAHPSLLLTYLTKELDDVPVLCRDEIHKLLLAWFQEAVKKWENIKETPNPKVLRFILNILIWLCKTEETYEMLTRDNFIKRLILILSKMGDSVVTQIGDVFIEFLSSIVDYESGLQLILWSKYWELIMKSKMHFQAQNISTPPSTFIAKLIKKAFSLDHSSCQIIVHTMLRPLIETANKRTVFDWQMDIVDFTIHESLSSSLHLIIEVLDDLLEHQITTDNKDILKLFTEQHDLEKCVCELLKVNRNDNLLHNLYRILIALTFSEMYIKLSHKKVICQGQKDFPTKIFGILEDITVNVSMTNSLKLLNASLNYWKILETKMPLWRTSKSSVEVSLGNQLASLLVYPATVYIFDEFSSIIADFREADDFRVHFVNVASETILPEVWKIYFKWKVGSGQNISLSQGIIALQHLLKSLHQCSKNQAIHIYQFLIYTVKDMYQVMKLRRDLVTSLFNQPEYITLLLQCITEFIDYFSFSWNDCVEALNILDHVYALLSYLDWPTDIIVNGLRLVDKAITKCMSPQMALLIERSDECSLNPFGPILRANLTKSDWKIRECSVSLIGTISANAITKYPSFRNVLLEHEFPYLVLTAAVVDESPLVRTAALRCLQEMTQVKECWNILLMKDILRTTLNILKTERDGIVRAEATILLSFAYQHQQIPEDTLAVLYEAMRHMALGDLDMRVRTKSLHFWKSVIDKVLTQRGMTDGTFPEVIFSKKLHKIVTLTEDRVNRILVEILHQLASNGCLSVFHAALQDPSSEVGEYARNLIVDFVTLLKRYKITSAGVSSTFDISPSTFPNSYVYDFDSKTITPPPSVVSHIQMDLSLLEECDNILHASPPSDTNIHLRKPPDESTVDFTQLKHLNPAEFVEFIYAKFERNSNKTKKWNDFNALLDEILYGKNVNSESNMDFL